MSADTLPTSLGVDAVDLSPFGHFEDEGALVIYDRGDDAAWIRSDAACPLAEMQ